MAEDVITLITADHRRVESLFERLKSKKGDQKATVIELHALLTAHARAEEDRVYPGLEAHHGLEEHKEAEILLDALKRADVGSPEFEQTLTELAESVNHHVEEEESTLLPMLAKKVGQQGLRKLGTAFAERRQEELEALSAAEGGRASRVGRTGGTATGRGAGRTARGMTKAELYRRAQAAHIEGRSQMTKQQLEKALQRKS
ncbi:hemerythrin domain-containing protein [Nonomuraea sp. NPDC049152]|uniref:hemerythrin domain-containing protein n=1 Tax=Nonomuraea sp. NPDC049152 TaxID=3154350 RepID=UPI0033FF5B2B